MQYLTLKEVLRLHFQVVEDFGGSHGVREEGRLLSVVNAPAQEVFGQAQYPSVFEKAAVCARNIITDHPFIDGNKRTCITCAGIFMVRNGYKLTASPEELEDFAVKIATEKPAIEVIAVWFSEHSKKN